jgi:ribosomal protein L40E
MKCPKCQSDNPVGIQFCGKCGTKLAKICSQCGFDNPPGFDFCGKCGQILAEPKAAPAQDYSQPLSYTPKHLIEKILAARTTIEGGQNEVF